MKRKIRLYCVVGLLIVGGLATLLYPIVGETLANHHRSTIITQYQHNTKVKPKQLQAELAQADKYNQQLVLQQKHQKVAKPIAYNATFADQKMLAYVEIPRLKLNLPVRHGTDDAVLKDGLGHLSQTSLPVGGTSTHAVLTGHSGLKTDRLFSELDQLKKQDAFYITVGKRKLKYQVDQIKTVKPTDMSQLQIETNQDYVTLLTCTPIGVNTHRLLVRGTRVPMDKQTPKQIQKAATPSYNLWAYGITAVTISGLLVTWGYHRKNLKR